MGQLTTLLPFIVMFVIFYFLLIRPQQKKQRDRNAMLRTVKKGDQVVTIGGVHGTVVDLSDDTVGLRVAHNVIMTFERSAVGSVKQVAAASETEAPATNA